MACISGTVVVVWPKSYYIDNIIFIVAKICVNILRIIQQYRAENKII